MSSEGTNPLPLLMSTEENHAAVLLDFLFPTIIPYEECSKIAYQINLQLGWSKMKISLEIGLFLNNTKKMMIGYSRVLMMTVTHVTLY